MKFYPILLVLIFFLSGKSCANEGSTANSNASNATTAVQKNDGQTGNNQRNPEHEKKVMKQFAEGSSNGTKGVWSNDDVQVFMEECVQKIKKNPSLDPNKYCSCLMGIMKDNYGTQQYSTAVKERGQEVARCLMAAKKD